MTELEGLANDVADWILLIGFVPYAVVMVDYVIIRPMLRDRTRIKPNGKPARRYGAWWESAIGSMFGGLLIGLVLLGGNVLASLFFGTDYPGRFIFRLFGYLAFGIAAALVGVVYFLENRSSHPILFTSRKDNRKMSDPNPSSLTPGPDHAAIANAVANSPIWFPNQRVIRSTIQAIVGVIPTVVAIIGILAAQWPAEWLIATAAAGVGINAALTKIMALPGVDAWLTNVGAGSVPKSAIAVTREGEVILPPTV